MKQKRPIDPSRKASGTLHSTVAGVEIRFTSSNQIFILLAGEYYYPTVRGYNLVLPEEVRLRIPAEAQSKIVELLRKQNLLRMSKPYKDDVEAERGFHFNDTDGGEEDISHRTGRSFGSSDL